MLRENFDANSLKFLKFDIPLMALTATATIQVQKDILKSVCMSNETKIVLTSLFRSNLRFSVSFPYSSFHFRGINNSCFNRIIFIVCFMFSLSVAAFFFFLWKPNPLLFAGKA